MFEDADDIVIPGFCGAELRAEDFPTELPEPRPKRPPTPHVTVHQYVHGSQPSLKSSPLNVGRRVAEMATTTSGWHAIEPLAFELTCRDDHSFVYAQAAPVLLSDVSPIGEKEWGEPPSPDEIFSTTDLEEFVSTDFPHPHPFISSTHPRVDEASPYDPYAEVHLSEMQPMPHTSSPSLDSAPPKIAAPLDPSTIPGFAPETPSMNSDAEPYGDYHPKLATAPRFERSYPSGSFSDADLYGSAPRNLSPSQGSDHLKSPQADTHRNREQIRIFDTSILLHAIPEPHFHPAPSADLSTARNSLVPPFTKSIPIPIYPSTDLSVEIYLGTPHGRGSWVIPIRGVLPWDGCTRARVLQPSPTPDAYPPKPSFEGYTDLVWTHSSLVGFWSVLRQMSKAEKVGNMGISFHADTSFNDDGPGYDKSAEYEPTPPDDFLLDTEPSDPRISLQLVDHIKIYCDVEFAMNVRTVLASWQYEWDERNAAEDAFDFDLSQASEIALYGKESHQFRVRKIQLLHGAKIPFLDHKNNGLFVC